MWMSRKVLKELYPDITWKFGEEDEKGMHYWGLYRGIPAILVFQTEGHDWHEDEEGYQIMQAQNVLWEVSCEGVSTTVVNRNLEEALTEFKPMWESHVEAIKRRGTMFLVTPTAEA